MNEFVNVLKQILQFKESEDQYQKMKENAVEGQDIKTVEKE